jgi:hypothetical protein
MAERRVVVTGGVSRRRNRAAVPIGGDGKKIFFLSQRRHPVRCLFPNSEPMRPLLFLSFFALLSCGKQTPDPDRPVRLRSERTEAGGYQQEYRYDERGNVLLQRSFTPPRQTPDSISYTYGPGRRLKRIDASTRGYLSCAACEGPALKTAQTFEYDAQARVAFINHLNNQNQIVSRIRFVYDSDRVSRIDRLRADYTPFSYLTWQYDARGNIIQEEEFGADGTLRYRRSYEYDDHPNPYQYLYLGTYVPLFRSPNNLLRDKYEYLGPPLGVPDPSYDWRPFATYTYDSVTGYPTRIESPGVVSVLRY